MRNSEFVILELRCDYIFPPSDEGGGKIEDFDGGRDKTT